MSSDTTATHYFPGQVIAGNLTAFEGGKFDNEQVRLVKCTYKIRSYEIWTIEEVGGCEDECLHYKVHIRIPEGPK